MPSQDDPITNADLMREMKKQATDVYGSRKHFAEALGVPDNSLGRYFRGERMMTADVLLKAIQLLEPTGDPAEFIRHARETRSAPPKGD